ncbi:MAG: hypothetical protein ACRDWY_05950 [Actinomycetes bacterium]
MTEPTHLVTEGGRCDTASAPVATSGVRRAGCQLFAVVGDPETVCMADAVFATFDSVSTPSDAPGVAIYRTRRDRHAINVSVDGLGTERRTIGGVLDFIQWHLNQRLVSGLGGSHTGLHAACASRRGSTVLLPAVSGAGKSTTVAGLARAGWDYLSDEAAVIETSTGRILPYAKPITIDHGAWSLFPEIVPRAPATDSWLVPATQLGAEVGAPARASYVVFPQYTDGARTRLCRLSPGAVAMELASCTFSFRDHGGVHLRRVAAIAREVPGLRMTIGDLDDAVEVLEELVG